MQRFYINLDFNKNISLKDKNLIHQITKVLRLRKEEEIILFNIQAKNSTKLDIVFDYVYKIKEISKREIKLEFIKKLENNSELDINTNLIQSLPNKISKIEDILKKGTQIGIHKFIFFKSERSQKLNISNNKITRLKKIIIESSEQSGRCHMPELEILDYNILEKNINLNKNIKKNIKKHTKEEEIKKIEELELLNSNKSINLFFHTKDDNSKLLKELNYLDINKKYKDINLIIGPEGGFSKKEISILNSLKYLNIYLGNRILRTETAGITTGFYIIQNLI